MAVAYPAGLPTVLASKRISKVPAFSMAQPRRGAPYVEPTGTDTPTIFEVEWLLQQPDAVTLRNWVETTLKRGTLQFTMPLRTEDGLLDVVCNFAPDGLLDRQRIGTLWRYTATIIARSVAEVEPIPEQEATFGVAFSADLSQFWPASAGPFVWELLTGTLPAGLTLNSATGVVSGTTTSAPLVFPVSVRRTNTADGSVFDSAVFNFVTARVIELVAPANCGSSQTVGITVGGFSAALTYRMTLLQTPRQAWSGFGSDSNNGGNTWLCYWRVNTTIFQPVITPNYFPTAAAAYAASAPFVGRITNASTYTFWLEDNNPADNRGGLTIKIRPDV